MKKIAKIIPLISSAVVVVSPCFITSCAASGITECKDINITVNHDKTVESWYSYGCVCTHQEFSVVFRLGVGYRQIDLIKTEIFNNGVKLQNNVDYVYEGWDKINFLFDRVKFENLTINLVTAATFNHWKRNWTKPVRVGKLIEEENTLCLEPEEILYKQDFDITAVRADKTSEKWEIGTEEGKQAQIWYAAPETNKDKQDITEEFLRSGFKITDEMIRKDESGKKQPSYVGIWIKGYYHNFLELGNMLLIAGYKPQSVSFEKIGSAAINEPLFLQPSVNFAPQGAFNNCRFEIVDSGTTQAEIINKSIIAKAAGVAKIKVVSLYDENISTTTEIEFN